MEQTLWTNYNFSIYAMWFFKISLDSRIIFEQNAWFSDFYIMKYKGDRFFKYLKMWNGHC